MPKKYENSLSAIETEEGEFISSTHYQKTENIPPELMMMIAEKAGNFLDDKMRIEIEAEKSRKAASRPAARKKKLKKMLDAWQETYTFSVGDFVEWKSNMRNRPRPYAKEPAIIIEILKKPLFNEEELDSPLFLEPLDIIVAIINEDDENGECFTLIHLDKRRLKPVG